MSDPPRRIRPVANMAGGRDRDLGGVLSGEGAGSDRIQSRIYNGANGIRDIEGKAPRVGAAMWAMTEFQSRKRRGLLLGPSHVPNSFPAKSWRLGAATAPIAG
jgi:hypothetical protein